MKSAIADRHQAANPSRLSEASGLKSPAIVVNIRKQVSRLSEASGLKSVARRAGDSGAAVSPLRGEACRCIRALPRFSILAPHEASGLE